MFFKKIKQQVITVLTSVALVSTYLTIQAPIHVAAKENSISSYTVLENGTLPFTNEQQLYLGNTDQKGRATFAHIQLKESDEPQKKRAKRLQYNPVGWHNYKFYYENGSKKAWLMNRGHLVGYQFSGLNDEKRNLVPMTAWLNSGNYKGTNQDNPDSMLYYEQRLDSWLATHKNYYLDYKVEAIYQGDELIPRQINLHYVGIDEKGQLLPISIGGQATQDTYGVSHVSLANTSPNATLDYATGVATNTVASAKEQANQKQQEEAARAAEQQRQQEEAQRIAAEQAAAEQQRQQEEAQRHAEEQQAAEQNRTVYIARQGTADVYWYSMDNMPSNTNWGNVVQMTKAEAEALGKRHTTKESGW